MPSPADQLRERELHNRELYLVLAAVITHWDPHGLMAAGAGAGEWNSEILQLAAEVPHIHSLADTVATTSGVFSESFNPEAFTPERCAAVGERLFIAPGSRGINRERIA